MKFSKKFRLDITFRPDSLKTSFNQQANPPDALKNGSIKKFLYQISGGVRIVSVSDYSEKLIVGDQLQLATVLFDVFDFRFAFLLQKTNKVVLRRNRNAIRFICWPTVIDGANRMFRVNFNIGRLKSKIAGQSLRMR